jgi:hypothetical protein
MHRCCLAQAKLVRAPIENLRATKAISPSQCCGTVPKPVGTSFLRSKKVETMLNTTRRCRLCMSWRLGNQFFPRRASSPADVVKCGGAYLLHYATLLAWSVETRKKGQTEGLWYVWYCVSQREFLTDLCRLPGPKLNRKAVGGRYTVIITVWQQ